MIKEKAYAKINLTLDVVEKRVDGYHELKMIMIPIDFYDELYFEKNDEIVLESNIEIKENAILKTVELMKERYKINEGATIKLIKKIPLGAGLAGGSANIAATIRGLNQLWNLNLEKEELEEIALKLGSDTLFCLYNQPAYVYGRGDKIEWIPYPDIEAIYLFTSDIHVSTKEVFKHHRIKHRFDRFPSVYHLYLNQEFEQFIEKTYNDLTKTTLKLYPTLKQKFYQIKKIDKNVKMSGSGATFYSVSFKSNDLDFESKIKEIGLQVLKTKPKT